MGMQDTSSPRPLNLPLALAESNLHGIPFLPTTTREASEESLTHRGRQHGAPLNSHCGERGEVKSMFMSGVCGLNSLVLGRHLSLH